MYDKPLLYDIAFSYRDYAAEVELLTAWYRRAAGRADGPASVLELAAGPADHAIEFASRGARAAALDLDEGMCGYARAKAARRGVALEVHRADMIEFDVPARFDLAITVISSLAHVYTVDDMARHLRTVARHLEPHGAYIVEMPHPSDFLWKRTRVGTRWTQARDGIEVAVSWGRDDDPYDPIAQVLDATVEMRARAPGREEEVLTGKVRMKEWTATEFEAVVKLSGAFEIAERHGDFALDAPFDASPESWRMIAVLRKAARA